MRSFFSSHPYWLLCAISVFFSSGYWSLIATDRYVSEANVVLQSPQISVASLNFSSILSGGAGSKDLLLFREYLLSVDMLNHIDSTLNLRSHYSSKDIDFISRLNNKNAPAEKFHQYFLSRVKANMDDYAGVLRIKVHAFDPVMANKIANILLHEGEKHMNDMGQRLAAEQVNFIESQVKILGERLRQSREDILKYQNRYGLISPAGAVKSLSTVVAVLDANLSDLNTQKTSLSSYQNVHSPEILKLNREIRAIRQQILAEQSRMATSNGDALNRVSAEYETLQLKAKFSLDLYTNALGALENSRVDAIRKLKQVSILQKPTIPEFSIAPRRIHNVLVYMILTVLIATIAHLITAIIRDHKD